MKLKRIITVLLCVSAVAVFTACSQGSYAPAGMNLVSDINVTGYNIYIPTNWVTESDTKSSIIKAYAILPSSDTGAEGENTNHRPNISMMAWEYNPETSADTSADTSTETAAVMTISQFWALYENDLKLTLSNFAYAPLESSDETGKEPDAVNGNAVLVANSPSQQYVYTASIGGTEYKFMQLIIQNNGNFYIFTYTAIPSRFDTYYTDVKSIYANLSFE